MKNNMTIKMISRFSQVLLIMVFAVGVLNIQFLELAPVQAEEIPKEIPSVMPGASAACGEDEFRACMEGKASGIMACGRACPFGEKPCLPGDPPGATCYGYDESCLNACPSTAIQECRTKTTCPSVSPKSSSPPSPTVSPPATTPPPTASVKPSPQPSPSEDQVSIANFDNFDDLMGISGTFSDEVVQLLEKKLPSTFRIVSIKNTNNSNVTEYLIAGDGDLIGSRIIQENVNTTFEPFRSFAETTTIFSEEEAKAQAYDELRAYEKIKILLPSGGDDSGGDDSTSNPFEFVDDPLENAFTEETESLAETKPGERGSFKEEWERMRALRPPPEDDNFPIYVLAIDGDGEVAIDDGSGPEDLYGRSEPTPISGGYLLPERGHIATDFDTTVTLVLPDGSTVTIEELSSMGILRNLRPGGREIAEETERKFDERVKLGEAEEDKKNPYRKIGQPILERGILRLNVETGRVYLEHPPGTFDTDTEVKAGNTTGAPRGTHFGVAYNPDTDAAVYEIYDGTINVTSGKTGKTVALSSSYDKPIKRVEIPKSGEFVYKTAIPGDEWQEREAAGDTNNRFSWYIIGAVAAALFITIFFVLQRKGIVRSKHGFVNIVLIITMAMLVGAVGYIVVTKNRSAPVVPSQTSVDATQTANPTSTPDQSSPINKIANWKLYRNDEYGFEFRYPEDVRLDINREDSLRVFKNFDRTKDTWNNSRTTENIQRINIAEYIRIYEKYGPNPVFSVQTIGANKSIIMEGAWLTIDHCGTRFSNAETVTFKGYKAEKVIDHLEVFGENGPYIAEELFQYCLNYPLSPIIIDFHSDIGELIFSTFKFIK